MHNSCLHNINGPFQRFCFEYQKMNLPPTVGVSINGRGEKLWRNQHSSNAARLVKPGQWKLLFRDTRTLFTTYVYICARVKVLPMICFKIPGLRSWAIFSILIRRDPLKIGSLLFPLIHTGTGGESINAGCIESRTIMTLISWLESWKISRRARLGLLRISWTGNRHGNSIIAWENCRTNCGLP